MKLTDCAFIVTLGVASSAEAASLSEKVEKLLNNADLDGARDLCTDGEAATHQDPLVRELCGEAFLDEAETTNTIRRWQQFRDKWAETKWVPEALSREASLVLSQLGYDADEVEYLKMSKQYKGTPEATLAKERAAQIAISAVKNGPHAVIVAKRYPERAKELMLDHLSAFVKVEFSEESEPTLIVKIPSIPVDEITWQWSVRDTSGTIEAWSRASEKLLQATGFTAGPVPPLCPADGVEIGIELQFERETGFVSAPTSGQCPTKPLLLTWVADQLVTYTDHLGSTVDLNGVDEIIDVALDRSSAMLTPSGLCFSTGEGWLTINFGDAQTVMTEKAPTVVATISSTNGYTVQGDDVHEVSAGQSVILRVQSPSEALQKRLTEVEGVLAVSMLDESAYLVSTKDDVRDKLAAVAVDAGLIELRGQRDDSASSASTEQDVPSITKQISPFALAAVGIKSNNQEQ